MSEREYLPWGAISTRYIVARDCGHATYETKHRVDGIEWCPTCAKYVGLIVTHKPKDAA